MAPGCKKPEVAAQRYLEALMLGKEIVLQDLAILTTSYLGAASSANLEHRRAHACSQMLTT